MSSHAPMIQVRQTTSTNDELARRWRNLTSRSLAYTTVLTDFQTEGRGRMERQWIAPARTSLLMSVLVPVPAAGATWVPLATALAVAQTLEALLPNADVQVKWPNDVLIDGKKIAGILTEYLGDDRGATWLSVGVGVNISQTAEQLPVVPSTSITLQGGKAIHPSSLAFQIRENLRDLLDRPDLASIYEQRCLSANAPVEVSLPTGQVLRGQGKGIDASGGLRIEDEGGADHIITAGDVQLLATTTATGGTR